MPTDVSSVLLCVSVEASAFTEHPLLMLRDHTWPPGLDAASATLLPSSRDTWLIDACVPKATHCHTIMALNDDRNVSDRLHKTLEKALYSILSQV